MMCSDVITVAYVLAHTTGNRATTFTYHMV